MDDQMMTVPKSQQTAMLEHLARAEGEAASRLRGASNAADRRRAEDDLVGVQVMKQRVAREWNVAK